MTTTYFFGQETTETTFKNDIIFIINDAATGFQKSKGNYISKEWITTYNYATTSIFNVPNAARIGYSPATYLKYSKENLPEEHFFYQNFNADDAQGNYAFENAERIFDELSEASKLKKKLEKKDKKVKSNSKSILYLKNNRKVFQLYFNLDKSSVTIYIHSDVRPNDLPIYVGCLVLYNIQMNSIVSANTYYVYGKNFKSAEYIYNNIISNMDATSQRLFSKYEWKPNASSKQISDLLKGLNVQENGRNVDVDGKTIK